MTHPTPEERAYDVLNRVGVPGWGDEITQALATTIREASALADAAATERAAKIAWAIAEEEGSEHCESVGCNCATVLADHIAAAIRGAGEGALKL